MFNLDNISVKEFFQLKDDQLFEQYMRFTDETNSFYLKPKRIFAKKTATPLGELTFGEVANLKHNLSKPTYQNIYECFDMVFKVKLVMRLVPFGELNTLKSLAQQFGKSPDEVENWKYNLVFSLMLHDKVSGEVQKAYNELKYGSKRKA